MGMTSVGIWFAAIVVNLVWSATFVSTQVLLDVFSPFEIQFMRYVVAWAVLWMMRPSACVVKSARDRIVFLAMGCVGVALYQSLENCAVGCLNAASTGVLMSIGPLLSVCALEIIRRRENRMTWKFVAGTTLACFGAVLACVGGRPDVSFPMRGTMAAFGAMFCWCVYAVGSDYLAKRGHGAVHIARGSFFWAVMSSVLVVFLKGVIKGSVPSLGSVCACLSRFDGKVIANLALLGVGASAICYVLWEWIGINGGYGRAVIMLYLAPVCTIFISKLAFDRSVPQEEWMGAVISVVGVVWAMNGFNSQECRVVKGSETSKGMLKDD